VLAVCAYAAYAREAARLLVTLAVVSWGRLSGVPPTSAQDLRLNAAALLHEPVASRLFVLARSLDVLMFGFLALVAVGLAKAIPGLTLRRAAAATLVSWLTYVGLAVVWGR
jgi:hypothetical protein